MKWGIDPIDGTTNFLHAIPVFALSVSLMDGDEVIAGVIYNPITNELYYAEKGQGAFLMTAGGNRRLRVSGRTKMAHALVCSNAFGYKKSRDVMTRISDKVASVRYNGSTTLALASVAAGQLDAYIACRFKLWDIAAGYLLIKEAGGFVSDFSAERNLFDIVKAQTIVATTMGLKESFLKEVEA